VLFGETGEVAPDVDGDKLLEKGAPSVVTVKLVVDLKLSAMGRSQDMELPVDLPGVIIDPAGIIVTASDPLDPADSLMENIPEEYRAQVHMQAKVTRMSVLLGDGSEELPAKVLVRDSALGLAFLELTETPEQALTAVDLSNLGAVTAGLELFTVHRMPETFGRAPLLASFRAAGLAEKPRRMWSLGATPGFIGLPAYDASGRPVGLVCRQKARIAGAAGAGAMMLPGMGGGGLEIPQPFLLAGEDLSRLIDSVKRKSAAANRRK
jgi:hypothetical protein